MTKQLGFILSTGRTGTMFFEKYINETSVKAFCLHEPKPSRKFIAYSNMYGAGKVSPEWYNKVFQNARKIILAKADKQIYIESNNFLWCGVEALNKENSNIKILHLVRHPNTYIKSHLSHGFWSLNKRIVRQVVPYFMVELDLPEGERNNPIAILAKRWTIINTRLNKYAETNPYLKIKFEDLFSNNEEIRLSEIKKIRMFFDLEPLSNDENLKWLSRKANTSESKDTNSGSILKHINKYCRELMSVYNYK